jgi:hypothetical protein
MLNMITFTGLFLNINIHVNTLWILSSSWTHMVRNSFTNHLSLCVLQDKILYLEEKIQKMKIDQ